ncbi:MAG: DUF1490 domain-containing protein [Clostridia bacterium]|nr:DUF1490 domain-containing protein [Clostridia bacterium]
MLSKCLKSCKFICFTCGAVTAIIGSRVLKSEKTRKACVQGLAKGMKLKHDAQVTLQNMKEEAQDIFCDAMQEADIEEDAE